MFEISTVTVRIANESDIPELVKVHRTGFSEEEIEYFGSFREMSEVFADVEVDSFKGMVQKPSFRKEWWLVAEKDGQVIGEVRAFPSWSREIGDLLFLVDLIVHGDFRGKGIGSRILGEVYQRAGEKRFSALVTVPEDIDGPEKIQEHRVLDHGPTANHTD